MVQPKTLTLLGKADPDVIEMFKASLAGGSNHHWFFVDYAEEEIPVGWSFDVLLQGVEKTLIPSIAKIVLKDIFDQFGNKLDTIPKGFQTICCFQFSQVPEEVGNLATIRDWEYSSNTVSLARHESIRISQPDAMLRVMHQVWMLEIKYELGGGKSSFSKPDVIQFIRKRYKVNDTAEITKVLNDWKMLGLAEEKPDNVLELIA